MVQRFFKLDKNYILKEAQQASREELLQQMVAFVKDTYLRQSNPLGLVDDTVLRIQEARHPHTHKLHDFYHILAGVYRFKHGSNQLELLFDGLSHFEKYKQDWARGFEEWYRGFCQKPNFVRAVLEVSVFYPRQRKGQLAEARMRAFLSQQFDSMRIHKRYGILADKTA
jgi:hypothetical protein